MLHGGPGFEHSIYRPVYSALSDIAQIVYLDHRGNGRSEDGPHERSNLKQWGDDVRAPFARYHRFHRTRRLVRRHDRDILRHASSGSSSQTRWFDNCRHAVVPDAPERALAVIRDFINRAK